MSAGDRDTLTDAEYEQLAEAGGAHVQPVVESIVAARVRAAQAQAWDEGYEQAERDVTQIGPLEKHNLPNPYLDAGDEFQNPED